MADKTEILGFAVPHTLGHVHAIAMTAAGEIIHCHTSSSEVWAWDDLGMSYKSHRNHEQYIERFGDQWVTKFIFIDNWEEYVKLLNTFLDQLIGDMFVHKVIYLETDRAPVWAVTSYKYGTSEYFDTPEEAQSFMEEERESDVDLEEQWEEDVWAEVDNERETLQARIKELESAIKEVYSAFYLDSMITRKGMTARAIIEHLDPLYVDIREKEEKLNDK